MQAFRLFGGGRGEITLEDLEKVARELGENIKHHELAAMIAIADTTASGTVCFEEFYQIMVAT